jgi:signal transduction histidine kinase
MNPHHGDKLPDAPRIVNVDDHESARYLRTRLLQRAGYRVLEASSAAMALECTRRVKPDLVLLDVNLPDGSGIDVCRSLKADEATASILILQISASATAAPQAAEALNSGADCYLVEPVDADVLVATVRALLRLQSAEREVARSNTALREANSRLEQVNLALRRSNEDIERFAYFTSHDLQEPLRTISTHLQLLERNLGGKLEENNQQLFHFVVDAAQRMSALIRDVLTYSRAGVGETSFQPLRLQEALDAALANLSDSLATSGGVVVSEELPVVWGDSTQLVQVFQNLISNALKYRSEALPQVEIRARRSGDDWVIAVKDNGMGIEPKYHDRIFWPFQRLHGHEVAGTGIGLALCRRIIERHRGRIWVESAADAGATFLFSLKPADLPPSR